MILLLIGLSFKDLTDTSIFPLSPLEILWVNLITSSFLALGLGMEAAAPDVLVRPPPTVAAIKNREGSGADDKATKEKRPLRSRVSIRRSAVFTWDLLRDKMLYGTAMGSLCLAAFTIVAYVGPLPTKEATGALIPTTVYNGTSARERLAARLGEGCNDAFNESCHVVFRARATAFSTLTFLLLLMAWEVKHFSRSLFAMDPELYSGPTAVFRTVWRNRFLFFAVVAGFFGVFPVLYIPKINRMVFKHEAITWEWGVVFACVVAYATFVESWKAVKRRLRLGEEFGTVGITTATAKGQRQRGPMLVAEA